MIRSDLTPGSAQAMLDVSPGGGIEFIYRTMANGNPSRSAISGTAPYWARVTRVGNTFTGYASPDGTTWTPGGQHDDRDGNLRLHWSAHVQPRRRDIGHRRLRQHHRHGRQRRRRSPRHQQRHPRRRPRSARPSITRSTATNTPASYNATGLPASLNINTSTGLISGTPTTATAANVTIRRNEQQWHRHGEFGSDDWQRDERPPLALAQSGHWFRRRDG